MLSRFANLTENYTGKVPAIKYRVEALDSGYAHSAFR